MLSSGPELTGAPERLLDLCPGVLFRQRADLSFEYISPQIEKWSGSSADEWLRQDDLLPQLVHEFDAASVKDYMAHCSQMLGETRVTFRIRNRRTGRITHLAESRRALRDAFGKLSGFEGVWLDVSTQALAARQLDVAAWHATFGLATLGAAHDLNNKLTAILSLSDLYLAEIDRTHPLRDGLTVIKQSAQQASQLLHQLAAMQQGSAGQREYVDVNQLVTVTVDLLRRVMPTRVGIETVLHNESLAVPVDRIALQRVVTSWAMHASARMPKRGTLKMQTRRALRDGKPFAALTITDQGHQVTVPEAGKEPFAVRETPEAATIDQLAVFAREHGGTLEMDSGPTGTTINLYLPEASFTEYHGELGKPWVLLLGTVPSELAELAQQLEAHGMMPVIAAGCVEEQLNPNWFSWSATIIQATVGAAPQLLEPVRKYKLPVKVVVCLAAGDISELEPWVASAAELVTPAEWSRERVAERIARLFQ